MTFKSALTLRIPDLMRFHSEKAEIFKTHGMIISRQKEVMALTILDQIGESNMQSSIKGADNSGSITFLIVGKRDVQSQGLKATPNLQGKSRGR